MNTPTHSHQRYLQAMAPTIQIVAPTSSNPRATIRSANFEYQVHPYDPTPLNRPFQPNQAFHLRDAMESFKKNTEFARAANLPEWKRLQDGSKGILALRSLVQAQIERSGTIGAGGGVLACELAKVVEKMGVVVQELRMVGYGMDRACNTRFAVGEGGEGGEGGELEEKGRSGV